MDCLSPIVGRDANKYKGDPLQDLRRDDSDSIALNNDLENYFEEQLPKNDQLEQQHQLSAEDLKDQISKILE